MMDPADLPPLDPREVLGHFLYSKREIKRGGVIHHRAFLPGKSGKLSVMRLRGASKEEIREVGSRIGALRDRVLLGRGDLEYWVFSRAGLEVVTAPEMGNPNHADVVGWPDIRQKRLTLAMMLAASATLVLYEASSG